MTWRGCRTYEPGFGGGGQVCVRQACTLKATEVQVRGRNPQERLSTCVALHWRGDAPAPFRGVAFVVGTATSGGSDTGDSFVAITVCEGSGWWVGRAARGADILLVRGRNLSPIPPLVAFGESTAVASVVAASAVVSGPTPQHTAHVGLRHTSTHGGTTPRHIDLNGGGRAGGGGGGGGGGGEGGSGGGGEGGEGGGEGGGAGGQRG